MCVRNTWGLSWDLEFILNCTSRGLPYYVAKMSSSTVDLWLSSTSRRSIDHHARLETEDTLCKTPYLKSACVHCMILHEISLHTKVWKHHRCWHAYQLSSKQCESLVHGLGAGVSASLKGCLHYMLQLLHARVCNSIFEPEMHYRHLSVQDSLSSRHALHYRYPVSSFYSYVDTLASHGWQAYMHALRAP